MLGRRRLRIKALQLLYAYRCGAASLQQLEDPDFFDRFLRHTFRGYLYLLNFLVRLGGFVEEYYAETLTVPAEFRAPEGQRHLRLHTNPILHWIRDDARFQQLTKAFDAYWKGDPQLLHRIFLHLKTTSEYQDYIRPADADLLMHLQILLFILKYYPTKFPHLQAHLDETLFTWEDDGETVLQWAVRSVKHAAQRRDFVAYPYVEPRNVEFARGLMVGAARHGERLVETHASPYLDSRRFRLQTSEVDRLILQMALFEMVHSDNPMQVLVNEYVYIARRYGHGASHRFINGLLDPIYRKLKGPVVVVNSKSKGA